MKSLDTKRHDDLFDKTAFDLPVHIIGTGGVGSHVAYELAKLGVGTNDSAHVRFYDGDIIEAHNIANQAYDLEHIDGPKVIALADQFMKWSGGIAAAPLHGYITGQIELQGIVFLCLDSMQARKDICQGSLWRNKDVSLVVDPRMDADSAVVFTIDPNNEDHIEFWEDRWFPDDEAQNQAGCGGHLSVITTVTITAALAVHQLIAFAKKRSTEGMRQYQRLTLSTFENSVKRL